MLSLSLSVLEYQVALMELLRWGIWKISVLPQIQLLTWAREVCFGLQKFSPYLLQGLGKPVRTLHLQHALIRHCLIPGKYWGICSEKPGSVRGRSTSVRTWVSLSWLKQRSSWMCTGVTADGSVWTCASSITTPFAAWREEGRKGKREHEVWTFRNELVKKFLSTWTCQSSVEDYAHWGE